MTNYEKYAGIADRLAELIIRLENENCVGEELSKQFCQGGCHGDDEDINCTDENMKKCIMAWLNADETRSCTNCLYEFSCNWNPAGEEDCCDEWKPEKRTEER